jgi:hypothetical protein
MTLAAEQGSDSLSGATEVGLEVLTSPDEVAQRLLLGAGDADGGEFAGAV